MPSNSARREWISYLRVSTHEQAERDLSLPAQRHAVEEYAARHGVKIAREYVEAGCSGTNANRKAFRKMLEDVLRPNSTVGTVVVHHTSRFTRDSTEARLVKQRLRKEGVRVMSVCQETTEDPIGNLIEGIFECIDQYESEVNGMRTSLAMMEAIRQGYFPSSWTPYGFRRVKVEIRPGVPRWTLEHQDEEAATVRMLFRLYVAGSGAKSVAIQLNERGLLYRRGRPWSTKLVLHVLDEPAVAGTYYWGRWSTKRKTRSHEAEWVPLPVTPIVTPAVHELAMKLRKQREPSRRPGRPVSPANLLAGVVRCGKCGASYQLESSGKRVRGDLYAYRYYNCSKFCRIGRAVCPGYRIRTNVLDEAVLAYLAGIICTPERAEALGQKAGGGTVDADELRNAWAALVTGGGAISRSYVLHLVDRIEVRENEIRIVARTTAAPSEEVAKESAAL
ncbi:MAG TPA: recombinase family protein [Gemmatimonadales bacterium]|jgi:DNA invertase Pin-like site-specific DNA recombinase